MKKNQFKHMATHARFLKCLKSNKHILCGGHYLPPITIMDGIEQSSSSIYPFILEYVV
jgi:hypothetical protein